MTATQESAMRTLVRVSKLVEQAASHAGQVTLSDHDLDHLAEVESNLQRFLDPCHGKRAVRPAKCP